MQTHATLCVYRHVHNDVVTEICSIDVSSPYIIQSLEVC